MENSIKKKLKRTRRNSSKGSTPSKENNQTISEKIEETKVEEIIENNLVKEQNNQVVEQENETINVELNEKSGLNALLTKSKFEDLPICEKTKQGLKDANFVSLTEIQEKSIGPLLTGKNLLGDAKTVNNFNSPFFLKIFFNFS